MLSFTASAALADSLTTGVVNANGTIQGGGPFTVSHPSAGRYIITFTSFTGVPLCLFNTIGSATNISSLGVSTKTCDVTFIGKKKKPTDALFVFFAI
jgi:hypothetical protein